MTQVTGEGERLDQGQRARLRRQRGGEPQLLGLAAAFGSAAATDLDRYDFDGSGAVGDGDLDMLSAEMGW
jgi:hypothetical protein